MKHRRLAIAVAAAAAIGAGLAVAQALRAPPAALARARPATAVDGGGGVRTAELELVAGQYTPNVVHGRAGVPLRLRITVRERHGCATRLLVPDLGIDAALLAGGTVDVLVPAARPGTYLFTCGQRMVKGSLVLE